MNMTEPQDAGEESFFPFLRESRPKTDFFGALFFLFLFFILYVSTSTLWAYPGESARIATIVTGALPSPIPSDSILRGVYSFIAGISGKVSVAATAVTNCFFSAAAIGCMYLFSLTLFRIFFDAESILDNLPLIRRDEAGNIIVEKDLIPLPLLPKILPYAGAVLASLALGFSTPMWNAASRLNTDTFYLPGFILSGWLLLRFMTDNKTRFSLLSMLLYGFLCSQSGAALAFLPFFIIGLAFACMYGKKRWTPAFCWPCLVFAAAWICGFLISVYAFKDSPGYEILRYPGPGKVAFTLFRTLLGSARSALSGVGWIILLGTIFLPWIAWIFIGYRSLNGFRQTSFIWLHAALIVASSIVLINSRYAPWTLSGFRSEQIFSMVLAATTFAYCALAIGQLYLFSVGRHWQAIERNWIKATREWGFVISAIASVFFLYAEASVSFRESNTGNIRFIREYADELLDGLEGRTFLVSDALFDDVFRLRARERNIPVEIVSLSEASTAMGQLMLREKLKNPHLRNALENGPVSFLQEYIGRTPDADKHLALTYFPDLWNIGPYRVYPRGLLFLAVPESQDIRSPNNDPEELSRNLAEYYRILSSLRPGIERVIPSGEENAIFSGGQSFSIRMAYEVRARMSLIGNNLAYYLENANRLPDALALYETVHAFDPNNISAVLNLHNLLNRCKKTAEQKEPEAAETKRLQTRFDEVSEELKTYRKNLNKSLSLWDLSRSMGYVSAPEAFAFLGWSWALSGQTPIALRTLGSALRDTSSEVSDTAILLSMAGIHARTGNAAASEQLYLQTLQNEPENASALIGLLHARLQLKKLDECEEIIRKLSTLNAPPALLRRETANVLLQRGNTAEAIRILEENRKDYENDPENMLSLFTAYSVAYAKETDETKKAEYYELLSSRARNLRYHQTARSFQGAIAMGSFLLMEKKYTEAREEFLIANKSMPGITSLIEQILRLDYGLQDYEGARTRARELLRINPGHGFANYILGSLAIQKKDWDSASAYLEKAVESWQSPIPLGDWAYAEFRAGNLRKAEELAKKALLSGKFIYEIWDTLGLILHNKGDAAGAVNAFTRAIEIRTNAYVSHLHLGLAYYDSGNTAAAAEILEMIEPHERTFRDDDLERFYLLWEKIHGISRKKQP